jgi:membrane-bound serine protease (ClpP class)
MIESLLIWGIALVMLALLLIVAEVFIPSGGMISLVAAAVAIAGIVCLFKVDWRWGLAGSGTLLVLGPAAFFFALQLMPSTKVGRRILFGESEVEKPVLPPDTRTEFEALIGMEGVALTDLHPVGVIRVKDQRLDALAEVSYVKAGQTVKIVSVEGTSIKVRPV